MWNPLNQPAHEAPQGGSAFWPEAGVAAAGWPTAADMLQQSMLGGVGPPPQSPSARGASPAFAGGPEGAGPHHSAAAKIYVQGLPQALQHPVAVAGLFAPFGDVLDVKLYAAEVRLSGGSAVVRMRTMPQAAAAIAALNGVVPDGGWQQLTVRAAESAEQRSSRISAINGRQGLGPPSPAALPPAGAAGALRRAQSGRSGSSAASLQCFTGALMGGSGADLLAVAAAGGRRSVDWPLPGGSSVSLDSRRSSMDAARCGRSSSDSGSEEAGGAPGNPAGVMQRMLLEAVLALVAQVEAGQLGLPDMRTALENALTAAKQATGGDDALNAAAATQTNNQGLTA